MTTEDADDIHQITIRVPAALVQRLHAHADRMRAAAPGRLSVARSDAIRALLVAALDSAEAHAKPKTTK